MTGYSGYHKHADMYPWILNSNTVSDYLSPEYYHKLLKKYSFSDLSDIEHFKLFIEGVRASKILELGCGSGRASEVALNTFPKSSFELVDLSQQMIEYSKIRFSHRKHIDFICKDAIDFLRNTNNKYDFIYSLWSFSHSIHQHTHRLGFDRALELVSRTLIKFIRQNLNEGGKAFFMHFDSMSEEQRILMRQWKREFSEFSNLSIQSPSKRMLDAILQDLDNHDEIVLSIKHMRGDPIIYSSEDEVLETFLNFHLETYFNRSPKLPAVLRDIKRGIAKYRHSDGSYRIKPGCYVYSFEKT